MSKTLTENPLVSSRRGFLGGGLALVASALSAPMRGFAAAVADASAPLPDYYRDYLAGIAAKVNALAAKTVDGFWFITDLHITSNVRNSGKALAALTPLTPLKKTFCGGDLPEAFSSRFESSKAGVDYAVNFYKSFWVDPIEGSGQLLYTAKGNHDFTIRYDAKTDDGFTYSGVEARRIVMGSKGCQKVVTNTADPEACYYYWDNVAAKVRYIVADTTDSVDPKAKYWAVRYGMHDAQILWLADNAVATIPDGWGAVVIHHIPITGVTGTVGDAKRFAPFRQLLETYQNRGRAKICGKDYDFTQAKGRILFDLCGHEHAERQTFQKGILHLTEPCDAAYGDYIIGSQPWCGDLPRKTRGTVYEQTFGAIQFDPTNDLVYVTRVGGGQDRVLHTKSCTVTCGEKRTFAATKLEGPVTWGCYDAEAVKFVPNPKSRYCPLVAYSNDVAEIAADGSLSAKKPGECMVVAMDAKFNKEIFPVTVA